MISLQINRTQYPEQALKENLKSLLGAPIIQKEEVIGQIRIYTHIEKHFKPHEKDFISTVANLLAMTLENVELKQYLQTRHDSNFNSAKEIEQFFVSPIYTHEDHQLQPS